MQIVYNQLFMDNEIIRLFKKIKSQHTIIVVLFSGKKLPRYCIPMPRKPKPKNNISLKGNFSEIYFSALKKNLSIQDGAILIQMNRSSQILKEFSCRLYPPPLNTPGPKNMGSGYNSSFDFSGVKKVICVYFINKNGVKKFTNGKEEVLFKLRTNKFNK